MKPNEIKAVNISDSHNLLKVTETVESEIACEVRFLINVLYASSGDISIPLYIQVCTGGNGYPGYFYQLKLVDDVTSRVVFKDIQSSGGRLASVKLEANINPTHTHTLFVTCRPSIKKTNWITRKVSYEPTMWLYVGAYGNQQVQYHF